MKNILTLHNVSLIIIIVKEARFPQFLILTGVFFNMYGTGAEGPGFAFGGGETTKGAGWGEDWGAGWGGGVGSGIHGAPFPQSKG